MTTTSTSAAVRNLEEKEYREKNDVALVMSEITKQIMENEGIESPLRFSEDSDLQITPRKIDKNRDCEVILEENSQFWKELWISFGANGEKHTREILLRAVKSAAEKTGNARVRVLGGCVVITGLESPAYWTFVSGVVPVVSKHEASYKAYFAGNITLAQRIGKVSEKMMPYGIDIMDVHKTEQYGALAKVLEDGTVSAKNIVYRDPRFINVSLFQNMYDKRTEYREGLDSVGYTL